MVETRTLKRDPDTTDVEDVAVEGAPPERGVEQKELRLCLKEVLREVAKDQGFVPFLLEQCMGMTPEETAEILGTNGNSIRQRTFRFRTRFRRAWKRGHQDEQEPFSNM